MLNGATIKLDPVLSCELVQPAAEKLFDIFRKGFDILYVYGPPGTGKSLAIEMFIDENNLAVHYMKDPPNTVLEVEALSRYNSLVDARVVAVVVDDMDRLTKKQLNNLLSVPWKHNRLILIGSEWKRSNNPFSKVSKDKKTVFKKVKFDKFKEDTISTVLLRLALKYKTSMTLEERTKIAQAADGDLRKALNAAKNYILSGKYDLESFIPESESAYINRVRRMFGGEYNAALEEVESFGWYYSVMIIQANLNKKKDSDDLMDLLMDLSMSKMQDRERYLALLACEMARRYGKGPYPKWIFPPKPKKHEPSEIQALCSDIKKEMYFW